MPKLKFPTKLRTSLGCIIAPVGTQSPTTKTRIQLRGDTSPSKVGPTPSFLKLISSRAAGEYAAGLDEDIGPEKIGSGPMGFGKFWTKNVLNMFEVC